MGKAPVKRITAVRKFTDRDEPRAAFNRIFEDALGHVDEFNVISYYGIGGFGKTRLINELSKQLDKYNEDNSDLNKIVHVCYDFARGTDKMFVLEKLRYLLKKQGLSFPHSDALDGAYNIKCGNPSYKTISEQQLIDNPMLSIIAKFIPGAPALLSSIKTGKSVLDEGVKYYNKARKWWDQEKKDLEAELKIIGKMEVSELEEKAAYYFALDLAGNTEHIQGEYRLPIVIFLDTYEELVNSYRAADYANAYDLWLRNDIIKTVPGVLWVIGGRERLRWDEIDPFWQGAIEEHELGDLSKADAFDFLTSAGIPDELLESIYAVTGGTPLFLDLNVSTYYELLASGQTVSAESFGANRQQVIERFLRYMNPQDQGIAKLLAVLENWSDEEAKEIGAKVLPSFDPDSYQNFIEHTIIIKDDNQRYYMHQQVRQVILQSALDNNPDMVRKTALAKMEYLGKLDFEKSDINTQYDIINKMVRIFESVRLDDQLDQQLHETFREKIEYLHEYGLSRLTLEAGKRLSALFGEGRPLYFSANYDYAMALYQANRCKEGLEYVEKAGTVFADYPKESTDDHYLGYLNGKGILLHGLKRYDEALECFNTVYDNLKAAGKQDSYLALSALNNIGLIHDGRREYDKAGQAFASGFRMAVNSLGIEYSLTQKLLGNSAHNYYVTRYYQFSFDFAQMAYLVQRNQKGDNHPVTLNALKLMADSEYELGKYAEAIEHYEKLIEDGKDVLTASQQQFRNNLALAYAKTGDFKKAFDAAVELVEMNNEAFGPDGRNSYLSADTFQQVYRMMNPSSSLEADLKAIVEKGKIDAVRTPEGSRLLYNTAKDYMALGELQKAREYYEKALEIRTDNLAEDNYERFKLLNWLGECCFWQKDYERALQCFRKYRELSGKVLGASTRQEVEGLQNICRTLEFMDNYDNLYDLQQNLLVYHVSDTGLYIDTAFELAVTGARCGKHNSVLPPLRKIMEYADDYIKPEEYTSLSEMQKKAQLYGRLDEFIRRELNMFADLIAMLDKLKEDKLRDFFTDIYHKRKEFLKQYIE